MKISFILCLIIIIIIPIVSATSVARLDTLEDCNRIYTDQGAPENSEEYYEHKYFCYSSAAEDEDRVETCDLIPTNIKYYCLGIASNDPSYCEFLTEINLTDRCYINVGTDTKDSSICYKTSTENRDNCFHSVANIKNDKKICDEIYSQEKRESCYFLAKKSNIFDKVFKRSFWINYKFHVYVILFILVLGALIYLTIKLVKSKSQNNNTKSINKIQQNPGSSMIKSPRKKTKP